MGKKTPPCDKHDGDRDGNQSQKQPLSCIVAWRGAEYKEEVMPIYYARLYGRLRELGLTQGDLGHVLKLSHTAISRRFLGRTPWTINEMYQVLDICRVAPEELHVYFPSPLKNRGAVA